MLQNAFSERLNDFGGWRDALLAEISNVQAWLEKQGMLGPDEELRVFELLDGLKRDKLIIALVAEFSRGKTELINAMFFADYKQRLLPSAAGRTTMCPTEILYDETLEPCLRLLPIETRRSALSIAEYKRAAINWTSLPLKIDSAEQMANTLQELVRTKSVPAREAQDLGLHVIEEGTENPNTVEIPVWRHAIINYPHPLLKKGLVVLDTPGLNALGSEPELTLSMLPSAHAVLFVLAADTGVTKTDLEIWNNHVRVATHARSNGRIAVLNKIDTLWDELQNENAINASIARQAEETIRVLGIGKNSVFPVSAQKGLLGKVRNDGDLLDRSGLLKLEAKLSTDIITRKQELLREKVVREIGSMVEATASMIQTRLDTASAELAEIQGLRGKNENVLTELSGRLREQKALYAKEVESFQVTHRMLMEQIKVLLTHLSVKSLDKLIAETRQEMKDSWTTHGMKQGMGTFFQGAANRMEKVSKETQQIRALIDTIYEKFHKDHGLARIRPVGFSVLPFRSELKRLEMESEAFRNSLMVVVTEQHFVIKKFFITLVSRAREIFNECNDATRTWAKAIMTPISTQIQEHKIMIDRRLENIDKIQNNHVSLNQRVAELEQVVQGLEQQRDVTRRIMARLYQPAPAAERVA